jgi:hypothetical protein
MPSTEIQRIGKDNIGRQIEAFGSQAVKHPRTPGGPARLELSAVDEAQRGSWSIESVVIERISVRSSTIRDVAAALGQFRSGLAALAELEGRFESLPACLSKWIRDPGRDNLAVPLVQLWLRIEQVHLARPAVLKRQMTDRPWV